MGETMEQEKKEAQVRVETLEARLKEWGVDLEKFRAKADETKGKAKTEMEREVAALRAKLNEAQKKLEELKKAGDAASGELKKGIEIAWFELKKAFDSATAMSKKSTKSIKPKQVHFDLFAPEAQKISLVGDFNGWDINGLPMKKEGKGYWKISINLDPGRYEYRFYANGTWLDDPKAQERVGNPFGTLNCVRVIT